MGNTRKSTSVLESIPKRKLIWCEKVSTQLLKCVQLFIVVKVDTHYTSQTVSQSLASHTLRWDRKGVACVTSWTWCACGVQLFIAIKLYIETNISHYFTEILFYKIQLVLVPPQSHGFLQMGIVPAWCHMLSDFTHCMSNWCSILFSLSWWSVQKHYPWWLLCSHWLF